MKKTILFGIGLIVIIVIGSTIFIASQQFSSDQRVVYPIEQTSSMPVTELSDVAGRISHNLILKNPMKKETDKVMVYKTLPPVVTREGTLEYARKFNVTGSLRDDSIVQSKDLRFGVEISKKSGRVIYSDFIRPNADQDSPELLPSEEDAVKIATKFLKDRDLFPEGTLEPVIHRENSYSIDNKLNFGQICVGYPRQLNGIRVEGTQLDVCVGGNGDVIEYFANWRKYESYKESPLISPEEAFGRLKANGVSVGMNKVDTIVSVDETYLAYRTKPGAETEEYLEPVWVFKGNITGDDNTITPVKHYIPALTDDAVKSLELS